ncbi:MAG: diguanylate cyclase [Nitrospiraceae bacterium]|nr:diguanylate cyclase [Nitrospiraceae bacterium]
MHGSRSGDQIIKDVTERLQQSLSVGTMIAQHAGTDTPVLARLADGQFAAFLSNLAEAEDSARVAQHFLDVLNRPFQVGTSSLTLSANLGIAIPGTDGTDAEQVLRHAATALQSAKPKGIIATSSTRTP